MWTPPSVSGCMPPQGYSGMGLSPLPSNAAVFSAAWNALRFPGMRQSTPDTHTPVHGLYPAAAALCKALLNSARTIWIDQPDKSLLHQWCLWRTEGLLSPSPEKADFTLVTCPSCMPALYHLNIGDGRDPATATTLLIQVPELDPQGDFLWDPSKNRVSPQKAIPGLPKAFWRQRFELQEMLPWGIDIFFIHDRSFVALPRNVSVAIAEPA
jgi:phosphonate C-P lyase system protein PhnH